MSYIIETLVFKPLLTHLANILMLSSACFSVQMFSLPEWM